MDGLTDNGCVAVGPCSRDSLGLGATLQTVITVYFCVDARTNERCGLVHRLSYTALAA
jgi:hypothetical protein